MQDTYGFLWIATTDGLGRFDGQDLVQFRYNPRDTNTLGNNVIMDLELDTAGNILVSTRNGWSVFMQEENKFLNFIGDPTSTTTGNSDIIHHTIQDQSGNYWYGTYNGLFLKPGLDQANKKILPDKNRLPQLSRDNVWQIHEDQKGRIWVGSGDGLILVEQGDSLSFQLFSHRDHAVHGLRAHQVWSFAEHTDGRLWIGTSQGVYQIEELEGNIHFTQAMPSILKDIYVNTLYLDRDSILWVGTYDRGLYAWSLVSNQLSHYQHRPGEETGLSLDQIKTIFRDQNETLFVGAGGAIDFSNPKMNR
ncbi:MAG: two-component regulator propeller domain-containing protein, partial [Bacteroidota bacterium]